MFALLDVACVNYFLLNEYMMMAMIMMNCTIVGTSWHCLVLSCQHVLMTSLLDVVTWRAAAVTLALTC